MANKKEKLFVIKKYIMATSAQDAMRKERHVRPDDCWVDDEWRKNKTDNLATALGYQTVREPD